MVRSHPLKVTKKEEAYNTRTSRKDLPAPEIAKDYWRLAPTASLLDVIYAVRSDETTHRFVNHSLANLDTGADVNPFAIREPGMEVKGGKTGFDRAEAERYVRESLALMQGQEREAVKAEATSTPAPSTQRAAAASA